MIDAAGRRVGRRVNGAWTNRWLYRDGIRPIAELDGAGAVQSVFVYGSRSNVPDVMLRGGRAYRLVSDHLGSVRRVVDATSGVVAQRLSYDSYGVVTEDSAPGFQPFAYAGGLYDVDTGLVRFGARDYDPVSGRWTAKDPSRFSGGLNLYEYANGDPVDFVDPSGNVIQAVIVRGLIFGTIGAVTSALGTYAEQRRTGHVNRTTIATSALVGFVSGALTPIWGQSLIGGATLGGVSNAVLLGINSALGQNSCNDPVLAQAIDAFVLGAVAGGISSFIGGRFVPAGTQPLQYVPPSYANAADKAFAARLNLSFELKANVSVRGFAGGVVGAWTTNAAFSPFRLLFSGIDPSRPYGI